jgi:hypothetical protein
MSNDLWNIAPNCCAPPFLVSPVQLKGIYFMLDIDVSA